MKTIGSSLISFILLLGCYSGIAQSDPKGAAVSPETLPVLDSVWWSRIDSLRSANRHAESARWLFANNRTLRASGMALFSAGEYARAGQADSAALAFSLALDYGMANPNIVRKYDELSIVRQSARWPTIERQLAQLGEQSSRMSNFAIDTSPLSTFWPYFHQALRDTTHARSLLAAYVASGSDAVRDFYLKRYHSPDNMYQRMIHKHPGHYLYTQKVLNPKKLDTIKTEVTKMMRRFAELYPATVFPKVYIVPGILNTGGTVSNVGLFIGGEMFVKTDSMSTEGLSEWQRNAVSEIDRMKYTIMHELMHFQQNYQDTAHANTLVAGVITEGVCDFLVELSSGKTMRHEVVQYLDHPDSLRTVLRDFREDMYADDLSDWMYGNRGPYPTDIGYALGYKICKSYYEHSDNPNEALYQLLNTDDFTEIIAGSQYSDLLATQP